MKLSPPQFVVYSFGNHTKLSEAIKIPMPTISNWNRVERIPTWHHDKILKAAKKRNIKLNLINLLKGGSVNTAEWKNWAASRRQIKLTA